jgi:O-antigen/teichoic acid export membrane protein
MNTLRKSLLLSFAEKYTLLLLNTGGAMIIARVLTPGEIGTYAIGAVLAGVAQSLRDFGVSQYVVQERELTAAKLRAAFATSVLMAWLLAIAVALLAQPLAGFYRQPVLAQVLHVQALNFVLIPFSAVTLPYLRRQMRFAAIYAINTVHCLAQLACEIWLASAGWGSVSLAWGAVAGTAGALMVALLVRPRELPWLPALRGTGRVLRFGAYATAGGVLDELGVSAPDLIVGKLIGLVQVGIFGKAMGLINMFNQLMTSAISPVLFPAFSAHAREGGDLKQAYLRTASAMAAVAWPFFAFLGLMAPAVVRVLYGGQWDAAVPLVRIMCASAALYCVFNMARYLMVAMGQVKSQAAVDTQATLVRVAAVLAAAPFGLQWVAWAIVAGALFRCLVTYRWLRTLLGLRLLELVAAVRCSAVVTLVCVLGPLSAQWLGTSAALWRLALAGCLAVPLWLAAMVTLRHELAVQIWRKR